MSGEGGWGDEEMDKREEEEGAGGAGVGVI